MSEAESKGAMPEPTNRPVTQQPPRDAAYWAKPVSGLTVGDVSSEANNLNVEGRRDGRPAAGLRPALAEDLSHPSGLRGHARAGGEGVEGEPAEPDAG